MKATLVTLSVLVAVTALPAQSQQRFFSLAEAVRVDALVTSRGQVLRGLTVKDFEVFDNGVAQQIALVNTERIPLTLALCMDASASVTGDRIRTIKASAREMLGMLHVNDETAIVTFDESVSIRSLPSVDHAALQTLIDRTTPSGRDTSLVDGAFAASALLTSDKMRGIVIVLSDGVDTSSWLTESEAVEAIKRFGVIVYAISTQKQDSSSFLSTITKATGGRLFEASDVGLVSSLRTILDELRSRYLISYIPSNVARVGWHSLRVRVNVKGALVTARDGYFVDGEGR